MLYDILVIDDALEKDFLPKHQKNHIDTLGKIFQNSDNDTQRKEKINQLPHSNDSQTLDAFNARQFIIELIRDNLRVTWTTGELADLKRMSKKDLSTIRYIFQDLHLTGTRDSDSYKSINSKIISILDKLSDFICHEKVTCFINSKFINEDYGAQGQEDLRSNLKKKFQEKYIIEVVKKKNMLSNEQKKELLNNNVQVYSRNLVINKTIAIENVFEEKLDLSDSAKENVFFNDKFLVFQSQFLNKSGDKNKDIKKQISLLQQIRNKLAHSNCDLGEIKCRSMKKTFHEIMGDSSAAAKNDPIEFNSFDNLVKYINSTDKLCESLKEIGMQDTPNNESND